MEARIVVTPAGNTYELKIAGRWMVVHTDPTHTAIPVWATPVAAQNAAARKNTGKILTWKNYTSKAYCADYAKQA